MKRLAPCSKYFVVSLSYVPLLVGATLANESRMWESAIRTRSGSIFGIPGGATTVLKIDPTSDLVESLEIEGPPRVDAAPFKWLQAVEALNNMIYAAPYAGRGVLKIDPQMEVVTMLGSFEDGCCKWKHLTAASNGHLYAVPYTAASVLKIDVLSDNVRLLGDFGSAKGKWSEGVAANGAIYGMPYSAKAILKVNPLTDVATVFGELPDGTGKWTSFIVTSGGTIFGVPGESTRVLAVDSWTDSIQMFGSLPAVGRKWGPPILSAEGFIFAPPDAAPNVLKIDPHHLTVELLGSVGTGGLKWNFATRTADGKIVALPYMANGILEVDPRTDNVEIYGNVGDGAGKWSTGVVSLDGTIYGIPDAADQVIQLDPKSRSIAFLGSLSTAGGGARKWTAAVSDSSICYAMPSDARAVLRIDTGRGSLRLLSIPGLSAATSGAKGPDSPSSHPVQTFCRDVSCRNGASRMPGYEALVCHQWPCERVCCVSGMSPSALLIPISLLLTAGMICSVRQLVRCKSERLRGGRFYRMTYFTMLFVWDVFDQAASWWFWQYTTVVGASQGVQIACLVSASIGMLALGGAFIAGLVVKTKFLADRKAPEFAYTLVAAISDIVMLFAMYFFEMEGKDEGSLAKILNLITTIIDFVIKILQATWTYLGLDADDGDLSDNESLMYNVE